MSIALCFHLHKCLNFSMQSAHAREKKPVLPAWQYGLWVEMTRIADGRVAASRGLTDS